MFGIEGGRGKHGLPGAPGSVRCQGQAAKGPGSQLAGGTFPPACFPIGEILGITAIFALKMFVLRIPESRTKTYQVCIQDL